MRRVLFSIAILVLVSSFVLAQGGNSVKPEVEAGKLFNDGNSLLRSGNYKAAI